MPISPQKKTKKKKSLAIADQSDITSMLFTLALGIRKTVNPALKSSPIVHR
jgi:hypothetical protein